MRIGELNKNNYAQFVRMINPNAKNAKMAEVKMTEARSKTDAGNFNPDEWANTNGMKGMYIGGGRDWKKIISVSEDVMGFKAHDINFFWGECFTPYRGVVWTK